jgi:hypothetical protein
MLSRFRLAAALAGLCLLALASGCASVSDAQSAGKPGVHVIEASAHGVPNSLPWGVAHEKAREAADAYCDRLGQRASPIEETVSDRTARLTFECHPRP